MFHYVLNEIFNNWCLQLLLVLTMELESLQIVVPHVVTVLQVAAPRTFTILYTIKRQIVTVSLTDVQFSQNVHMMYSSN